MSVDLSVIGAHKVKSIPCGEVVELKSFWQDQDVAIIFFRRWGCIFCRLWAKELGEIASILKKNNVRLVGIGLETAGSKEFIDGKFFDGDLYYVEDLSTYQSLGFKRFNVVTILTSLLWKQSREAIVKGKSLGVGGDLKGDWVQTGGALLVGQGGELLRHFTQTGPSDHLSNKEILQLFDLEREYKAEKMANRRREEIDCNTEATP
ncbi:prostamide/prostaglandin F synthase-like isoform X1 [Maniola hyperantus]|uniref:prostamide/prostaglandin F synthase-like isoform X1 n=1 Tax=Aphantopus hyperantus TaxID=2795564 RepID=UPI001568E6C3|nr:prostamide/prostaglandin F synthase-like [Maniola hyperantus]